VKKKKMPGHELPIYVLAATHCGPEKFKKVQAKKNREVKY